MFAVLRAALWWVPLLLILLAIGVILLRGRVAAAGGLDVPYPPASATAVAGPSDALRPPLADAIDAPLWAGTAAPRDAPPPPPAQGVAGGLEPASPDAPGLMTPYGQVPEPDVAEGSK